MSVPLVSVIVPVHNRAHFVADAVNSALAQTLGDLEMIVVDDGSTDNGAGVVAAMGDSRVRVVVLPTNRGIPEARNAGLALSRGRYVAWLDSDDVARPTRLAEQIAFLDAHPEIALVGACAGKLRADGARKRGVRVPPLAHDDIAAWMLFRSAFQQSSVTGRGEVLRANPYDPAFPVCEDLELFGRLSRTHRLANLPRALVDRRVHPAQTVREGQGRVRERKRVLARPMLERLGLDPTEEELDRHVLLGKARLPGVAIAPDFLAWTRDWLDAIRQANDRARLFDPESLRLATGVCWLLACRAAIPALGHRAAAAALASSPMPLALLSRHHLRWTAQAARIAARG